MISDNDYQFKCEEVEALQSKVNKMAEDSAFQAAVIRNLREALCDVTKERDLLQQQVETIHHFTDPDFGVQ